MANPYRGEVSLEVDGKTYILRPKLNSCIALQEQMGKGFAAICALAAAQDLEALRGLVWANLQAYHDDEIKTLEDAGDWIDRVGGMERVEQKFAELDRLNAPPGEAETRPLEAQARLTGEPSTRTLVGSPT